jgi:hypothetical protein
LYPPGIHEIGRPPPMQPPGTYPIVVPPPSNAPPMAPPGTYTQPAAPSVPAAPSAVAPSAPYYGPAMPIATLVPYDEPSYFMPISHRRRGLG